MPVSDPNTALRNLLAQHFDARLEVRADGADLVIGPALDGDVVLRGYSPLGASLVALFAAWLGESAAPPAASPTSEGSPEATSAEVTAAEAEADPMTHTSLAARVEALARSLARSEAAAWVAGQPVSEPDEEG